jgi:hypothetical protein
MQFIIFSTLFHKNHTHITRAPSIPILESYFLNLWTIRNMSGGTEMVLGAPTAHITEVEQ